MKLISINNIEKKDVPLYYRNEYDAQSEFLFLGDSTVKIPIYFSVEMAPTGEKKIDVRIKESINFPIVPILKFLKDEIISMEKKGLLL